MKLKYWVILILLLTTGFNAVCAGDVMAEADKGELAITCEGNYDSPLYDIATDKKYIWWSFGKVIVKTDFTGKKLLEHKIKNEWGVIEGVFIHNNELIAIAAKKDMSARVLIYNAETLVLIKNIILPHWNATTPRDVAFNNGLFYMVGVAAGKDASSLSVYVYDGDFNFIKKQSVKTVEYTTGANHIVFDDKHFYLTCTSGRPKNVLFKVNLDFKRVDGYRTYCAVGLDRVEDGSFLVGRTLLKRKKVGEEWQETWVGLVRSAHLTKDGIDVIGSRRMRVASYADMPANYMQNRKKHAAERSVNPYAAVDWHNSQQILTSTHMHGRTQRTHDRVYQRDVRFVTYSNYYPSIPHYPISEGKFDHYWSSITDGMRKHGKVIDDPRNLQEIILDPVTGWQGEVAPKLQAKLFRAPLHTTKHTHPKGLIQAPNAEHYSFKSVPLHMSSPGSMFSSGHFDSSNKYRLSEHGYSRGVGMPWPMVFDQVIEKLIYKDGGGVIINHPGRSHLSIEQITGFLDFDPRVLGIEIYNSGWSWTEDLWNDVLRTGRQAYGFFVPDHGAQFHDDWVGVNVLLVPELTARECLKAYRQGHFYGAIKGKGLKFTEIKATDEKITVVTDKAQKIEFITEKGIVKTIHANEATFVLPVAKDGGVDVTFVRIRAFEFADNNKLYTKFERKKHKYLGKGEVIFSQPMMYKNEEEVGRVSKSSKN